MKNTRVWTHVLGWTLTLCALVDASGCGDGRSPHGELTTDENGWTFALSRELDPGQEENVCITQVVETDMDVVAISPETGGYTLVHHLLLWKHPSSGSNAVWDCGDSLPDPTMGSGIWASGSKDGLMQLPEGTAMHIAKGSRLTLNAHFLNATGQVTTARAALRLQFQPKDQPVEQYVGLWSLADYDFSILSHSTGRTRVECTAPEGADVLVVVPHMHSGARLMTVERLVGGQDQPWLTFHGPDDKAMELLTPQVRVGAGETVVLECEIENPRDTAATAPDEMCNAFLYVIGWQDTVVCM
ncbi:MAG: hypothetical protein AB2A00_12045 [Myxococcota bacterium]